jgi:hypothetical protein
MSVGARVRVSAMWSSFYSLRGVVTSVTPCMVKLDVYESPIRIDPESLTVEPPKS